jgi:hypothetical protein
MRWLLVLAGLHGVSAVVCGVALAMRSPFVDGVHPALKPLKFSISIGLLLATVAIILRALEAPSVLRSGIAVALASTLVVEMIAITTQAIRGRPSHYNTATSLDAWIWHVMATAIVIALVALVVLAVVATAYPLRLEPIVAAAFRIGLWVMILVAVSGFAMAGRGAHGSLRVPHFFALHGLQVLPVCAWMVLQLPPGTARWIVFGAASVLWIAISIATLIRAL